MGSSSKLTIFFEDPFWVAIAEEEDSSEYKVARHVFGPEPTQPQVEKLVISQWDRLRFTSKTQDISTPAPTQNIGYKRAQRLAKKAMKASEGCGTKAQQALQAQREASKAEAVSKRHSLNEQRRDARFAQKQEKRKQKARGH